MDNGEQFALLDLDRKKQVCISSKLSVSGLCLGCQRVTSVIITTSKYSERQQSFWLQKWKNLTTPVGQYIYLSLIMRIFFLMGIEPNGWHFDTFKLIKCTCGLILQMSPVEFWDISEAFLSAARLMDSASRIP